jgi:hypothetical protein
MKYHLMLLAVVALVRTTAFAQTIEFNPPAAATPQLDKFTIVFNDGVSLPEARRIVEEIQPAAIEIKFSDVDVVADTDRMLTDEEAGLFINDKRVTSFRIESRPRGFPTNQSRLRVVVSVDAQFTAYEARKIVARLPFLRISTVRKSLNEIEVQLQSESPETVAKLEALPQVKYVAYLAAE